MGDHAAMQRADGFAAPRQAEPGKQAVHEAGQGARHHAGAEAERRSHVLEVGLVDRGRMISEALEHVAILGIGREKGLRVLRLAARFGENNSKEARMAAKLSLDTFDKKILDCLQDEADMALAEVARRVGLSTTPCWRRINRLQEAGIIRARVALLE